MLAAIATGAGIVLAIIAAVLAYAGVAMIRHALRQGDGGMGEFIMGAVVCVLAGGFATGAYFAAF